MKLQSKQALLKSIQKGTISAQKNAQKKWIIDPAELFRVYPPKKVVGKNDSEVTTKNNDDSLKILLLQKNEALYEERLKDWKERNQELKERNQELKEELARTNQRLLDQPKQWQEEREKKELELNKILQEEREKKEQELNKILELQQTKQQEQRKAEQKRQLVFFLILLILSAGLFLGLN